MPSLRMRNVELKDLPALWHRLTAPRAHAVAEAHAEYMTKAILVIFGTLAGSATLGGFIGAFIGLLNWDIAVGALLMTLILGCGEWLAQRAYWKLSSHIPGALIFILAVYINVNYGTKSIGAVFFAVGVFLIGMLRNRREQNGAILLSIGGYLLIAWLHTRGHLPIALQDKNSLPMRTAGISIALVCVAFLQRLSQERRQRAVAQAQAAAREAHRHQQHAERQAREVERLAEQERQAQAEQQRLQHQLLESQQQTLDAQRQAIRVLSTPIIPLMEHIIVMPLVGSIDTARARDITRSLLAGISTYRARVVILDITGVPVVDSAVAAHLDKTIQAAKLKGTRTIITGISDAVAEAIVDLGIGWRRLETRRDLQTGLLAALRSLGIRITADKHRVNYSTYAD